ncbi:MAG: lytic transglycosylase F [Deltaproteobacteria bacterium]|nr:lytic transglycosylase F [Deltaproteobacteria bacterium]
MNSRIVTVTSIFAALLFIVFLSIDFAEAQDVKSLLRLDQEWTGDFDGMVERHLIRALVPYSKTFYFLDGADQRGLEYELLKEFEKYINTRLKRRHLKVRLVVIPTKRDELLPNLAKGLGDIAAGNLTITPERLKQIDFSDPYFKGVNEILVAGPAASQVKTVEDLSGKEIHVRASSSYYASLKSLNAKFKKAGKKQMKLVLADEYLEDEDLLEMMNANLIPMIIIDSHKGEFWKQIFTDLTLYPDIKVREGGQIAWAVRKNSPKLEEVIDGFMKKHRKGTLMGNILFKRYLKSTKWVRNSLSDEEFQRFKEAVQFFKKYAEMYDFDWLLIAALAYQESRIDQSKRSPAGAIGVMQLLPSTATDRNVGIQNIEKIENNIHAGVKYLRFMIDRYYAKEPMDRLNKGLFALASYNAGPAKVARLRKEARDMGLDPNVWFRNVEIVAAKRIGRETVQYVSNIYKYYVAYRLIVDKRALKMGGK